MTQETKNFCTIKYTDKDGIEVVDSAILSKTEQLELMNKFIEHGIEATIYDHTMSVNSDDESVEKTF